MESDYSKIGLMDLYVIRRALAREALYWTNTKRKDVRPSEKAVTYAGVMKAYNGVKAECDKREEANSGHL